MQLFKRILETSRKQLQVERSILLLNGLTLLLFFAFAIYAKVFASEKGGGFVFSALFDQPPPDPRLNIGFLTKVTQVLWGLPAIICAFSFSLLRSITFKRKADWFILCSALLTLALLIDDHFRVGTILHSYAGVPKVLTYSVYGIATLTYGTFFWRRLLVTPYVLLLIAGVLFAISVGTDLLPLKGVGTPVMLEDGTQLLGQLNISLYFWQVCRQEIMRSLIH